MRIISSVTAFIGWGRDHIESDRLFMDEYRHYCPCSLEEYQRLQDALLRTFKQLGLVELVEEVTGLRFRFWDNFNKLSWGQRARHNPRNWEAEFTVDIHEPRVTVWQENQVSCRNPASEWLNIVHRRYDNRLCLMIAKGPPDSFRNAIMWLGPNGILEIKGERVTFKGKIPTDPTERAQTIVRVLMSALTNPMVYEREEMVPISETIAV